MNKVLSKQDKIDLCNETLKILDRNDFEQYFQPLVEENTYDYLGLLLDDKDAKELRDDVWVRLNDIIGIVLELKPTKEIDEHKAVCREIKTGKNGYEKAEADKCEREEIEEIENAYKSNILKILLNSMREFILFRGSNIDEKKYRDQIKPLAKIIDKELREYMLAQDKLSRRLNRRVKEYKKPHIPFLPTDNYHIAKQRLLKLGISKVKIKELLELAFDKTSYQCSKALKDYQVVAYKLDFKKRLQKRTFQQVSKRLTPIKEKIRNKGLAYLPSDALYMFKADKEMKDLELMKLVTVETKDACDAENDPKYQKALENSKKEREKSKKIFY